MPLTPGLTFLFKHVPILLLPSCVTYVVLSLLPRGVRLPSYLPVLLVALSAPVYHILRLTWGMYARSRDVARLGAREIPLWSGRWPGHIDLLMKFYEQTCNGYTGDGLDDATEELGMTFRSNFMGSEMIFTSDPECMKKILFSDFSGYEKGEFFLGALLALLGNGIFASDGELWKYHRGLARPFFKKDRTCDLDIFEGYADSAIVQAKERFKEGFAIDLQDLIQRFALDCSTSFLLGSCVDCLAVPLPYPAPTSAKKTTSLPTLDTHPAQAFTDALVRCTDIVLRRARLGPMWPLGEIFRDATVPDVAIISGFMDPIVARAVEVKVQREKSGEGVREDKDTLLAQMAMATDNVKIMTDHVRNVLVAGTDTTASLITFTCYHLSRHPNIAARMREEIGKKVGFERPPTFEDIKEMKYIRAVLNETLRLYPSAPFIFRTSVTARLWPSSTPSDKPLYVPPNTPIMLATVLTHHSKDLWGPDALEFDPDRWLDERQKYLNANSYIFQPFSAGPRICMGMDFAYNEASFFMIRLLQTFDTITHDKESQPLWSQPPSEWREGVNKTKRKAKEEIWPETSLVTSIKGGFWVKMREARNDEF